MNLGTEAVLVGAANVAAWYIVTRFTNNPVLAAFVAGAGFHLTAEWTGVNQSYCWERRRRWIRNGKSKHNKKRCSYSLGSSSHFQALCSTDTSTAPSLTMTVMS